MSSYEVIIRPAARRDLQNFPIKFMIELSKR